MKKIKIALIATAAVIGVGSAIVSAKPAEQLYIYTAGTQTWNQSPLDQDPSHYQAVPTSPTCTPSSNICTYTNDGTQFVQNTEGTHQ